MGRWERALVAKGPWQEDKTRIVPATVELMLEPTRYRNANDLPPFPCERNAFPLLLPIIGAVRPVVCRAVHELVEDVFRQTAAA